VIGFAVAHYRELLRRDGTTAELDRAVGALDGCLSALEYVDRNANLAMVIQQWSDELADPSPSSSNLSLV
jgi:hypothetical protein